MKRLITTTLLAIFAFTFMQAKNISTTVTQVSQAVTLDTDVDYHITSATPFTDAGSINITNTEHAVVIMDAIRPSDASSYLSYIKINGQAASNGSNCQLKMYRNGSILLPYGGSSFYPLTIYDDINCQGNSYNALTEGHNGSGYMKNLPTAWNNKIRSFTLKRGYMVTFALGDTGQGYSRCFIAADEDITVTLPSLMDRRITSYRLFKWYDASKKAIADKVNANSCKQLKVTSTFTWSAGSSLLPDVEVVPHHIYENWPSASDLGKATYSCHMKTNNEPANSSDDHPQDLATILANWESLMRTGLRLCTPSSWDGSDYWNGSGNLIKPFLDSIDARGWRCDIVDAHCYWPEGNFQYLQSYWVNNYKRPVWVSEWCWGASWNNNGSFSGSATETTFKNAIQSITTTMNNAAGVERYFYWDSENGNYPCRLVRDGSLTQAGEYYAQMNAPLAYNGSVNYIPTNPRTYAPTNIKSSFVASSMTAKVSWTLKNGELSDSVALLRSTDNGKKYELLKGYSHDEIASKTTMTYNDTIQSTGNYTYMIKDIALGKTLSSSATTVSVGGSEKITADLQFGTISTTPGEEAQIFFAEKFSEYPVLIGGSPNYNNTGTNNNAKAMVNNYLSSKTVNNEYSYANFRENVWKDADGNPVAATDAATTSFFVGKPGNGDIGGLKYELGFVSKEESESGYISGSISYDNARKISNKDSIICEVKFRQPFATKPVVMVTPLAFNTSMQLTMWRIWDVTTEGFKVLMMRQKGNTVTTQNSLMIGYMAIEQGQGRDGKGHLYTVSEKEETYTTATKVFNFDSELTNPRVMVQLQTYNLKTPAVLRTANISNSSVRVYYHVDITNSGMYITRTNPATESFGFICISEDNGEITPDSFMVDDMAFKVSGQAAEKTVTYVKGPSAEQMTVPSSVTYAEQAYSVTAIADSAFAGLQQLKSVRIPSSVKSAGKNLFAGSSHVAAITWEAPIKMTQEMAGNVTNNPNLLFYTNDVSNAPENVTNVINLQTKQAERIVLSDANEGNDFYCPEEFTASSIIYTHDYQLFTETGKCQGWETLTLPYDVTEIIHETNGIITPFGALQRGYEYENGTKPFWLYEYTTSGTFAEAETIRANMPYIISMPNEAKLSEDYILKGNVTFEGSNVTVKATSATKVVTSGIYQFTPNYQNGTPETVYLLNVDMNYDGNPKGCVFVRNDLLERQVRPFEAYFHLSDSAGVKPYFSIFEKMTDGIKEIVPNNTSDFIEVYDLSGRQIQRKNLQPGIYIISGKTVMVK